MLLRLILSLGAVSWLVHSLATTDTISDADPPQSGYLPNHNMQPAIVGSSSFGMLWTNTYNAKELWYAKPLVYTPPGQKQLVFTASNQNWIRTVDAVTGVLINSRQVQPPFLQSDIGCTDMPNYIGVAGTPIIDPVTSTVYFFAKGYKNNAAGGGVANGIYKFYAVDIVDLTDRPGFPVLIDGHNADNDPTRYFIGGTVLQRPSLTMVGSTVYGTFGGHCDLFNYTGMITGVSTTAGVGVTSMFAMEASPGAPAVTTDIMKQVGGKSGIWMSGMAPATDGNRIFVVTGNGMGHENKDTPASGRSPLSTLDEVVANFDVSGGKKLALQDYFEPYEYIGMDAGDRDLGSGGVTLLDPTVFKGTNGVSRIAVTIGKNGKAYIMNADNLGGYKLGPGATDNLIQTIIADNAVFGGAGSYPLEGGYIYFTPVGSPTLAYKLGHDQNGNPLFSKVGQSADNSAGRVGVGVPTITTYKGQSGTGIVWVTDVDGGLKAYKAVPDSSGNLVKINITPTGGLNKFQRPAFGDGRLYVTDTKGRVICLGSPVSLPLNCTSPIDFGDVTFGSTKTVKVDCTALVPITKLSGVSTLDPTFQVSNASLPQGSLKAGDAFSFPVTWNLTKADVKDDSGASFGSVSPGVKTSSLTISTVNAVAQYSNSLPITLQGNEISSAPFLSLSPAEVDMGGLVVGGSGAATGLDSSFILANIGSAPLKITGMGWTSGDSDDDDDDAGGFTNSTKQGTISTIGNGFTSKDLPAVGSVINPGQSLTVPVNFKSSKVGNYQSLLQLWTTGGNRNILFTASATTSPIAELAVETSEGGWTVDGEMDFGSVLAGTTVTRRIRICNKGGSPLLITKSKPPIDAELRAENPSSDLHEGQSVPVGQCEYGPIDIAAAPEAANVAPHDVSDVWVLNTDDLTFGVHEVEVRATIVSRQLGPTYDNGTAKYQYLGCYLDQPRQMQKNYNLGKGNDNGACQKQCLANGYRFASTEYHVECWCGNNPPVASLYTPESAKKCTFGCSNDTTQACGGDGTYASIYYDASKYTPDCKAKPCDSSSSSISSMSTTSSTSSRSSTSSVSSTSSTASSVSSTTSKSSTSPTSSVSSTSSTSSTSGHTSSSSSASSTSSSSATSRSSSSSSSSSSASSISSTPSSSSSASSISSTSSRSSSSSSTSSTSSTSSSSPSSSSSTVFAPTTTSTNPGNADFKSIGCYKDGATKAISPASRYVDDKMTVALCLTYCKSKGSSYAGLEYHRECYCGNAIAADATPNAKGCTLTCMGKATEYCGGSNQMNIYKLATIPDSTSSSTSLTSSASSSSSVSSSSSTTSSSSFSSSITSSQSSSSSSSSTSTRSSSTLSTTTSGRTFTIPSATGTPTSGFYSIGCYAEPPAPTAKPWRQILAADNMSPELCISAAQAKLTARPPVTYRAVGVEYGRECWGATTTLTSQTSLVGDKACTYTCAGDGTESCGGRAQFNYYVTSSGSGGIMASVVVSTTGTVKATATPKSL